MNDAAKAAIARQERQNQSQNQNQGITKYFQRQTTGNVPQAPRSRPNMSQIQGNLSEDEALARALQASLGDASGSSSGTGNESSLTQEEQDRMLALSLAQGEQQTTTTGRTGTSSNSDKSCQIS